MDMSGPVLCRGLRETALSLLLHSFQQNVPSIVRRRAMEQRHNIKFCFKLGKTATETHEMLVQVYGQDAVSRKCVYDWFARLRAGKELMEDEPRSGRPSTSRTPKNIERVRVLLAKDWRLTLRLIAEEVRISKDTVGAIIHEDLGKRKICSRFVPHILTD